MTRFDVDLFVIGGGSGGVRAARVAAEHGAKVIIAEADRWGGTCVIRGCVPKKLLVYASEVSRSIDDARGHGWTIEGARHDWPSLIAAKDNEIARLSKAYAERLKKAGVEIVHGRATVTERHAVTVDGRTVTAAHILIAVGGVPKRPPGNWITSDEAFHLPQLPTRVGILGGGYIGVEFAHIFAGLGSKVTLVHRDTHVLRGFDPDVREQATKGLTAHGIDVIACNEVVMTGPTTLKAGARSIEVDCAMAAIGRSPCTPGLGLTEVGVKLDGRGAVIVDEMSRSSVPHIYAVGDVSGRVALTPVAIREGHAVADTLFGKRPTPIHHRLIPTAVFSQPPCAAIGFTEPAAREAGHDVVVFRAKFRPMRYALSGRDEQVLIKVVVDKQDDRVLGVHLVGPDTPEIVQAIAVAMTMGAKKADLDRTFALHPTTAEELVLLR
ncbi:MAG: glutathione-disulfide reductase [Deltaproteobacteria bacterium]|nr:glutathione-disulfide reductase [Deltaproteobacteria bacterium]